MSNTALRLAGVAAATAVAAVVGPHAALVSPPPAHAAPAAHLAAHAAAAPPPRAAAGARGHRHGARLRVRDARHGRRRAHRDPAREQGARAAPRRAPAPRRGKTAADLFAALKAGGPPPKWVHEVGGPNAPAPGRTSAAVVDLAPGTYAFICVIPSPDGTPHVAKGMARPFTVVAEPRVRPAANVGGAAAAPRPWSSARPT
jgi:hypothetical protein